MPPGKPRHAGYGLSRIPLKLHAAMLRATSACPTCLSGKGRSPFEQDLVRSNPLLGIALILEKVLEISLRRVEEVARDLEVLGFLVLDLLH